MITYNARGIGVSQGSSAWFTPGNDPADFAAVEAWAVKFLGGSGSVQDVRRLVCASHDIWQDHSRRRAEIPQGYSWGCMAATLAPLPPRTSYTISSLMLVSPTIAFLPALTYFSGSFNTTLSALLAKGVRVWMIYGDSDQFTGVGRYRAWTQGMLGMERMEMVGDHFWRGEAGERMREWFGRWLSEE